MVQGAHIEKMELPSLELDGLSLRYNATDANGRFEMKLRAGTWKLCPSKTSEGYFPAELPRYGVYSDGECQIVTVPSGEAVSVNLMLGPKLGSLRGKIEGWNLVRHERSLKMLIKCVSRLRSENFPASVYPDAESYEVDLAQSMDVEGSFNYAGLQPGRYTLSLTVNGRTVWPSEKKEQNVFDVDNRNPTIVSIVIPPKLTLEDKVELKEYAATISEKSEQADPNIYLPVGDKWPNPRIMIQQRGVYILREGHMEIRSSLSALARDLADLPSTAWSLGRVVLVSLDGRCPGLLQLIDPTKRQKAPLKQPVNQSNCPDTNKMKKILAALDIDVLDTPL